MSRYPTWWRWRVLGTGESVPQQRPEQTVYCDVEEEAVATVTGADEEKPIVALEKERMRDHRADGYGLQEQEQEQHQLSSLSDLASRQSTDSLDQDECGGGDGGGGGDGDGGLLLLLQHGADDPDDGNYPGSCLSAEDSGIHTEDMSSCVSQADDEEQRSNLQPSPVHHHNNQEQEQEHEQKHRKEQEQDHQEQERERESPRPQRADGYMPFGGDMVCTDLNVDKYETVRIRVQKE